MVFMSQNTLFIQCAIWKILIFCAFIYFCSAQQNGMKYQALTAQQKQTFIYDKCNAKAGSQGDYKDLKDILRDAVRDFNPTFDHGSDKLPYKGGKTIHEIGWVTKAKFQALSNPFTGAFQGSDHVILRLSLAAKGSKTKIIPSVGVKFLRSNIRSGNFVAMHSSNGQSSLNFFEKEFSNHIPLPTDPVQKIGILKFKTASRIPNKVGLSDLAKFQEDGTEVPSNDISFPFQLILRPNPELDFKMEELGSIQIGTKLWDVLAQKTPEATELIPIGSFVTTSTLIKSKYGDNVLFFQHQRMEDDLKLQPDWKKYVCKRKIPGLQRCPFL